MGTDTTHQMVITAVCSGMSQSGAARTYGVCVASDGPLSLRGPVYIPAYLASRQPEPDQLQIPDRVV